MSERTTKPPARQQDDDYQGYDDAPIDADIDVRQGTSMVPAQREYPMATGYAPGSTQGLSELVVTPEQVKILRAPLNQENEIELLPTGVPYVPGGVCHERLIQAFGPGQVAMRQERDPFFDSSTGECVYDGSLWINGQFVARALGGCRYRVNNASMTKSDAIEGAKTDCIKRCCKELGIGAELRNPTFRREYLEEWGIPYQGEGWNSEIKKRGPKVMWRKRGVPLEGAALDSATAIGGEFPLGFNENSPMPDGPMAGQPISAAPNDMLQKLAEKATTRDWRLVAKAEIVRRANEARAKAAEEAAKENAPAATTEVSLEDVLNTEQG